MKERIQLTSSHDIARQALDAARSAAHRNDFAEALAKYEWFFNHALDGDASSYYGVRLSYCLSEWARLGTAYPPARERLEARFAERLDSFFRSRDPEQFHDYLEIARVLDRSTEAIAKFTEIHSNDRELAASSIRFVWDRLVAAGEWEVCAKYVGDEARRYSAAIDNFRAAMQVCESDPDLGGEEFATQIRGWLQRDVANLIDVLVHAGRVADAERICLLANSDVQSEGIPIQAFTVPKG